MYAVVVRVKINDAEKAQQGLENDVVPRVSGSPGFRAAYWTRSNEGGANGLSMLIFDSEENARAVADRIPEGLPDAVTLDSVEVREVAASA